MGEKGVLPVRETLSQSRLMILVFCHRGLEMVYDLSGHINESGMVKYTVITGVLKMVKKLRDRCKSFRSHL